MTICKICGEPVPAFSDGCPLCSAEWECRELRFPPVPVEDAKLRLGDWPSTLAQPALLAIEAGETGLRVRLYTQRGASADPSAGWSAATRQQSRWVEMENGFPGGHCLFALKTNELLPVFAAASADPFLTVGSALLARARASRKPATLILAIHGREDRLQARLRNLFAYTTGTEKGVEDDTPNPWSLRLKMWRMVMAAGAAAAALGGALYAPGWITFGPGVLLALGGCVLALAGFLGTQRWMQLRSLPRQVVEPRLEGALLGISIAFAGDDPGPLRPLAGEQRWVRLRSLWPGARKFVFPAHSGDIAAMIAPLEAGEGSGLFAPGTVQEVPSPAPARALTTAAFKIGVSPNGGERIGIDAAGHTLIVGGSRSGKSSAVFNLLLEMLAEPAGSPGLFLVDPHGSLADAFLHSVDLLPAGNRAAAVDRLRVITPQPGTLVPLNPLMLPDFNWAGNALVQAGQRIWTDFWGPRMQAALLALARLVHAWNRAPPTAGMGLMHTIFAAYQPEWRAAARSLLAPEHHAGAEALEALLGHDSSGGRPNRQWVTEVVSPIVSKLMALELAPWLYAALHQDGFVDMEGWIKNGSWIVLRLPSGEMGREGARLMAGMVYNIFEAAFRKVSTRSPVPYHFVIDEVQEIGGAMALENLLSEGGKFGVRIFVLAQSLSLLRQIEGFGPVVQALLANTSAQMFFSPDPDDAYIIRDMLNLPARYGSTTADIPTLHAWLRARLGGQWQPPTLVRVNPLITAEPERVRRVIQDVITAHPDSYVQESRLQAGIQTLMENSAPGNAPSSGPAGPDSRKLGW